MNNANRQRLMNLKRELKELFSVITSLSNKKNELRYKPKRTRANNVTLRHVKNKINSLNSRRLALTREEIALRRKVWQNAHPGQPFHVVPFSNWYKQNQKKYQARIALSLTNLPLNMRRLIVSHIK